MHPRLVPFNFDYHIQVIVCNSACLTRAGLSELREGGGDCLLKWGFMWTFPGNKNATLK